MSKGYHIIYSPEALNDLTGIYSYIAFELLAEENAFRQVNHIRDKIRKLDVFPEGYAVVDWEPWQAMGMRKLPVDNYVVYFLVDTVSYLVTIVRIFYAGQDIKNMI